jgi:4-hydroxybenzoate polyprenyltransferase
MNFISKWFWKRAVRHELLSAGKTLALVGGLLLILAGILGAISLVLGLVFGVGAILLSGRLKHRLWAGGILIAGILVFSEAGGFVAEGGAILIVTAAALGLASTLV